MGSGAEFTSSNKLISFAIANAKMLCADTGTNVEAAVKRDGGQLGYATTATAGKLKGNYYGLNPSATLWQNLQGPISFPVKQGTLAPTNATITSNTFGLLRIAAATGTSALATIDTTWGLANTLLSAGSGSAANLNMALVYTERDFNPMIKCVYKNSLSTNIRIFLGWTSSTAAIANSDTPLDNLSGFGIGKLTTSANYRIIHNDGDATDEDDDTGVAADTAYHTFELWADTTNAKFWSSIDGATPTGTTTEIPAATTGLSCQFCSIGTAAANTASMANIYISSDR